MLIGCYEASLISTQIRPLTEENLCVRSADAEFLVTSVERADAMQICGKVNEAPQINTEGARLPAGQLKREISRQKKNRKQREVRASRHWHRSPAEQAAFKVKENTRRRRGRIAHKQACTPVSPALVKVAEQPEPASAVNQVDVGWVRIDLRRFIRDRLMPGSQQMCEVQSADNYGALSGMQPCYMFDGHNMYLVRVHVLARANIANCMDFMHSMSRGILFCASCE